jgi:hypothetical protein
VDLGRFCIQRRDYQAARAYLEEAQPHHQAALTASPKQPEYRQFYHYNLMALVEAHAGLLDQAAAVRTAEQLCDLGWYPAGDAYNAACALALCIPIVEKQEPAVQAKAAMQFYANEAMKMLKSAIAKGWKNAGHMKKDTDLDPLRQHEDFKKLIADLEDKNKK